MKKFKFSMQKVLEYKMHIEDREKAVLAQLRSQYEKLRVQMEKMEEQYNKLKAECIQMCLEGVVIREMAVIKSYMTELTEQMAQLVLKIERAEKEIDKQIDKITEIAKEKNSMEKLRGRYHVEYQEKQRKEMENFIDGFVANTAHLESRQ